MPHFSSPYKPGDIVYSVDWIKYMAIRVEILYVVFGAYDKKGKRDLKFVISHLEDNGDADNVKALDEIYIDKDELMADYSFTDKEYRDYILEDKLMATNGVPF